ncbi:hypothetical protein D3C71_336760 [compost metagenome]
MATNSALLPSIKCGAALNIQVCTAIGMAPKPKPHTATSSMAVTEWLPNAARARVDKPSTAPVTISAARSWRPAAQPPTRLPMKPKAPYTSSMALTVPAARCDTCVRKGAIYV